MDVQATNKQRAMSKGRTNKEAKGQGTREERREKRQEGTDKQLERQSFIGAGYGGGSWIALWGRGEKRHKRERRRARRIPLEALIGPTSR